jgi:hypothetical protein
MSKKRKTHVAELNLQLPLIKSPVAKTAKIEIISTVT